MTTALKRYRTPPDGWTTDDLDVLPEDGIRRELVDGLLIVHPAASTVHQILTIHLWNALDESCPREYEVTHAVEVRVSKRRSFIPDVLAVTAEAAARNPRRFQPHEVLLAIEIVSPSSTGMDRVAKPGFYAEAGIPLYWRMETETGLVVHTHRLCGGQVYEKSGEFTGIVAVDEPWEIRIPMKRLVPRFMGMSVDRDPDRGGEDELA
jgi:Uma2 family endonuclease